MTKPQARYAKTGDGLRIAIRNWAQGRLERAAGRGIPVLLRRHRQAVAMAVKMPPWPRPDEAIAIQRFWSTG